MKIITIQDTPTISRDELCLKELEYRKGYSSEKDTTNGKINGVKVKESRRDAYIYSDDGNIELEVVGRDLYIFCKANLPNLKAVGGNIFINSNVKTPILEVAGGCIAIGRNASLEANSLKSTGRYVHIDGYSVLDAPKLRVINGYIGVARKAKANLESLRMAGGGFHIGEDATFIAPKLEIANGHISTESDVSLPRLRTVVDYVCSEPEVKLKIPKIKAIGGWVRGELASRKRIKSISYKINCMNTQNALSVSIRKDMSHIVFLDFLRLGFVFIYGILSRKISKKGDIYKCRSIEDGSIFYIAKRNSICECGDTLRSAYENMMTEIKEELRNKDQVERAKRSLEYKFDIE